MSITKSSRICDLFAAFYQAEFTNKQELCKDLSKLLERSRTIRSWTSVGSFLDTLDGLTFNETYASLYIAISELLGLAKATVSLDDTALSALITLSTVGSDDELCHELFDFIKNTNDCVNAKVSEILESTEISDELRSALNNTSNTSNTIKPKFVASQTFEGIRNGYVFADGPAGIGYYLFTIPMNFIDSLADVVNVSTDNNVTYVANVTDELIDLEQSEQSEQSEPHAPRRLQKKRRANLSPADPVHKLFAAFHSVLDDGDGNAKQKICDYLRNAIDSRQINGKEPIENFLEYLSNVRGTDADVAANVAHHVRYVTG